MEKIAVLTSRHGEGAPPLANQGCSFLASKWKISKLVIAQMHTDGTLWQSVAILICAAVTVVGLSKFALNYIALQHERLAAGNFWVNIYNNGIFVSSRPFSQLDVTVAYIEVALGGCLATAFFVLPYLYVKENIEMAYAKVQEAPT